MLLLLLLVLLLLQLVLQEWVWEMEKEERWQWWHALMTQLRVCSSQHKACAQQVQWMKVRV